MGESMFYAKIRLISKKRAEKAYPEIKAFFKEGARASDFWQENRGRSPEDFWPEFSGEFPTVYEYLKTINSADKDCNNDLAGILDFGIEDDVDNHMNLNGYEIWYSAYIWHLSSWDGFSIFINKKWGGDMKWLNDEDANMFDLL